MGKCGWNLANTVSLGVNIMKIIFNTRIRMAFKTKSPRVYLNSSPSMVMGFDWQQAFLLTMYCMNQTIQHTDTSNYIHKWYGYIINDLSCS